MNQKQAALLLIQKIGETITSVGSEISELEEILAAAQNEETRLDQSIDVQTWNRYMSISRLAVDLKMLVVI